MKAQRVFESDSRTRRLRKTSLKALRHALSNRGYFVTHWQLLCVDVWLHHMYINLPRAERDVKYPEHYLLLLIKRV